MAALWEEPNARRHMSGRGVFNVTILDVNSRQKSIQGWKWDNRWDRWGCGLVPGNRNLESGAEAFRKGVCGWH